MCRLRSASGVSWHCGDSGRSSPPSGKHKQHKTTDSWNSPNPTDYIASLPAALRQDVAISSSDMSHDRLSRTFLGRVFSQTPNPASIFSNGRTTRQQTTTTAMSSLELHGDRHFTPRGRLIGWLSSVGEVVLPFLLQQAVTNPNFGIGGRDWKTGQPSLKTDPGSTVIVWRPSHPSARRRAPVPHTCCFTRAARQLVAGNVHVSRARDGKGGSAGNPRAGYSGREQLLPTDALNRLSAF